MGSPSRDLARDGRRQRQWGEGSSVEECGLMGCLRMWMRELGGVSAEEKVSGHQELVGSSFLREGVRGRAACWSWKDGGSLGHWGGGKDTG